MSRLTITKLLVLVAPLAIVLGGGGCGGSVTSDSSSTPPTTEQPRDPVPVAPTPTNERPSTPPSAAASQGSSSGRCTTTAAAYSPAFGGVAGGDAICASELPGSHFYRRSLDERRVFQPAQAQWPRGYGEIEGGDCMNCRGWTASASGNFDPKGNSAAGCINGYATVAALVPQGGDPNSTGAWRICEGANWPLTCCFP